MLTNKEIKDHQIQLTSEKILKEYQNRQQVKKAPFNWKKFFYVSAPVALSLAIAIPLSVYYLNKPGKVPTVSTLIDVKEGSRLSNAVVSSLCLLDNQAGSPFKGLIRQQNVDQSSFSRIVDVYEKADSLVQVQLDQKIESYAEAKDVDYKGQYGHYNYLITIKGNQTIEYYFNYTKDDKDVSFNGEVTYEKVCYRIEGKNKVEGVETEYEYTASIDEKNYIKIEEEKEVDEYSYEYTVIKNGEESYVFSYEKSENVELTFTADSLSYAFEVDYSTSIWEINYESGDYEGKMSLERKDGKKIYTDEATQIKIYK
ncbi:MAG: hypothetical protein LKJ88_05575 [Bacilli bacterium]|jgi:hypothetical protein|nr:hypothetical protein [Bacilli bacterium]